MRLPPGPERAERRRGVGIAGKRGQGTERRREGEKGAGRGEACVQRTRCTCLSAGYSAQAHAARQCSNAGVGA
eukprot:1917761-Rhodomonas_salina.2